MDEEYTVAYGTGFDKKLKKALKKHRNCFEDDFNNIQRTILTEFEKTRHTDRIQGLKEKYSHYPIYKTRMIVTELRGPHARVIWHPCHEKKQILFVDIYLKSAQDNHDPILIKETIDEYYSTPQIEEKPAASDQRAAGN